MKTSPSRREMPEIASFTRYYEHDGMLRAYANRAMFLAVLFAMIALGSLGFAIYVRIQPPTVIRVDKDGNAVVMGGGSRQDRTAQMTMMLSAQATGPDDPVSAGVAPTDIEGKAIVRRFLDHYLSYTPDSAPRNLAESLNMMTSNLRTFTLNKLRDDDTVGKIQQNHIISDLRIRSIERTKNAPWDYVVFGVRELHQVNSGAEVTDRIVGQYNVRLVEERRSEFNPSGLLVAEYSEKQMVGERDNRLERRANLISKGLVTRRDEGMTNGAGETMTARSPTTDGSTDKEATRTRRSRTNPDEESDDNAQHYFLSKTNGADGTPVLNREVANEGEELVEALRLGVTFYAVQEFHAIPDFSGQRSQLNKEVVKGR